MIEEYNLQNKVINNGYVYVEVWKGMYGLPHSGIIGHHLFEKRLHKHGYHQSKYTSGLWTHAFRPIFPLVVDDFGFNYVGKENDENLMKVLGEY